MPHGVTKNSRVALPFRGLKLVTFFVRADIRSKCIKAIAEVSKAGDNVARDSQFCNES